MWYGLQTFIFLIKLFSPLDRTSTCFEDDSPIARASYKLQNAAVLNYGCPPRTSDAAICASEKVAGSVCWLIYQELAIFSHFLALQLVNSVWFALWPFSGSITTWIFDSLNCWCFTGLKCCLDGLLHLLHAFLSNSWQKILKHITMFFAKQHFECDSFFLRNHVILHTFVI